MQRGTEIAEDVAKGWAYDALPNSAKVLSNARPVDVTMPTRLLSWYSLNRRRHARFARLLRSGSSGGFTGTADRPTSPVPKFARAYDAAGASERGVKLAGHAEVIHRHYGRARSCPRHPYRRRSLLPQLKVQRS
jgi:hypothetical protein